MFMNQVSIFEKDEMTAFEFFNINLTLIITVSIKYSPYKKPRDTIKLFIK